MNLQHGERYGELTVLALNRSKKRGPTYRCGCSCGNSRFYAKASDLAHGLVKMCGRCLRASANSNALEIKEKT